MAAERIVEKRAHELEPGDRVMELHDDGVRRPHVIAEVSPVWTSAGGDLLNVFFDDDRSSCFGRMDRVRVADREEHPNA